MCRIMACESVTWRAVISVLCGAMVPMCALVRGGTRLVHKHGGIDRRAAEEHARGREAFHRHRRGEHQHQNESNEAHHA
jgi:hypothetical protein